MPQPRSHLAWLQRGRSVEPGGVRSPLPAQPAAQLMGMQAPGTPPSTRGRGPDLACGLWRLGCDGEACNPEGLAGGLKKGGRDSLSKGKRLPASSLQGWSGAPILLANRPGTGLS